MLSGCRGYIKTRRLSVKRPSARDASQCVSGGFAVSKTSSYKVIGTRPIRHDGLDKVTGRALYGADIQMAGLLHGRILRSPHAHANIRSIDARQALALPGVEAVVTSADLPDVG